MSKKKELPKELIQPTSVLGELHNFINDLFQLKTGEMFRVKLTPESVIALKIPDYFNHITQAMDLITIKEKLNHQQYKYISEIEEDLNLMFDNCFNYNANTPRVVNVAKKFKESVISRLGKLKSSIESSGLSLKNEIFYNVSFQLKGEQRYEKEHEQTLNKVAQMIRDIYNLASASYFRHKLTDEYLVIARIPQYKMIIKNPMDLVTIAEKFVEKRYRTVSDIVSDVYLMIDNFFEFNKQNDALLKTAKKFKGAFEKRWKKIHHFFQGSIMKEKTPIDYKAAKFNLSLEELLRKEKETNSISLEHESSIHESIFNEESAAIRNPQNFWDGMRQFSESSRDRIELSSPSNSNLFFSPPAHAKNTKATGTSNFQDSLFSLNMTDSQSLIPEIKFPPLRESNSQEGINEKIQAESSQDRLDFFIDLEGAHSAMGLENQWKTPALQKTPNLPKKRGVSTEWVENQNSLHRESNQILSSTSVKEVRSNPLNCEGSFSEKTSMKFEVSPRDRLFEEIPLTVSVILESSKTLQDPNVQMDIQKEVESSNAKHPVGMQYSSSFEIPEAKRLKSPHYTDQFNSEESKIRGSKSLLINSTVNASNSVSILPNEALGFEIGPGFEHEVQNIPGFYELTGQFERLIEDKDRKIQLRKSDIEEAYKFYSESKIEKYKEKLTKYIRKLIHLVNKERKFQNTEFQTLKDEIAHMNEHKSINCSHLLLFLSFTTVILENQMKKPAVAVSERTVNQLLKLMNKLRLLIERYQEIMGLEFKAEDTAQFNEKRRKFRRQIERDFKKPQDTIDEIPAPVTMKTNSSIKEKPIDDKEATKITLPTALLGNMIKIAPQTIKQKEDSENLKVRKSIEEYLIKLKGSYERVFGKDLWDRIHGSWNPKVSCYAESKIEEDKKSSRLVCESEKILIPLEKEQSLTEECTMVDDNCTGSIFEQQVCFSIKKPTNYAINKYQSSNLLSIFSLENQDSPKKKPHISDSARRSSETTRKQRPKKEQEDPIVYKPWNHGNEPENQFIPGEPSMMIFSQTTLSGKVEFNIRDYCKLEFINFCTVLGLEAYIYGNKAALDQKKMQEWKSNGIKVSFMYYENSSTRRYPYSKFNFLKLIFRVNLNRLDREVEKMLLVTGHKVKFTLGNMLANETANLFMNLQKNVIDEEFNLLQSSRLLSYEQAVHNYYELNTLENTVNLLELSKLSKFESVCAYIGMRKLNQEGTQLEGVILTAFDDLNNLSVDISMGVNKKSSKVI